MKRLSSSCLFCSDGSLTVPMDGEELRHVVLELLVQLLADLLPGLLSSSPDGGLTEGHLVQVQAFPVLLDRLQDSRDQMHGFAGGCVGSVHCSRNMRRTQDVPGLLGLLFISASSSSSGEEVSSSERLAASED